MSKSFQFTNVDQQRLSAPTWLNKVFEWGPSQWPLPWCEAVHSRVIDCGVFAAFAKEIFLEQGFEAYSGQVIQYYEEQNLIHMKKRWESAGFKANWIAKSCVYHEVCAVRVSSEEIKIYDPTDGLWIDPNKTSGAGAVLSLRLELPTVMQWGSYTINQDQWLDLL